MDIESKVTCIEFTIKMCPAELKAIQSWKQMLVHVDNGVECIPGGLCGLYSFLQRFTLEGEKEEA
jgi:ferredoxin-like protein FixX